MESAGPGREKWQTAQAVRRARACEEAREQQHQIAFHSGYRACRPGADLVPAAHTTSHSVERPTAALWRPKRPPTCRGECLPRVTAQRACIQRQPCQVPHRATAQTPADPVQCCPPGAQLLKPRPCDDAGCLPWLGPKLRRLGALTPYYRYLSCPLTERATNPRSNSASAEDTLLASRYVLACACVWPSRRAMFWLPSAWPW